MVNLPGVGDVRVPANPQSPAYDRVKAVNFVLDVVRSEIRQEIPKKKPNESYVVGDALNLLDEEILTDLLGVTSGAQLEDFLAKFGGEAKRVADIKRAGDDPVIRSWLTRVVVSIKDEYMRATQSS